MATVTTDQLAGLSIQEVARRTGFSESTLRYYERIGLIDPVPRATSSSHRRYAAETVDTLEALACLRSTGMSIGDMRAYLNGVAEGLTAAPRMVALFAAHALRLKALFPKSSDQHLPSFRRNENLRICISSFPCFPVPP